MDTDLFPEKVGGPRYDYRGLECDHTVERDFREATFYGKCEHCELAQLFKRVYTRFVHKPGMHDHFNHSVGAPVSSMRGYKDLLKRKSDEHAEYINHDVNYQPVDMQDHQALGITGEGIYESNKRRSREGNPLLREIPGEV